MTGFKYDRVKADPYDIMNACLVINDLTNGDEKFATWMVEAVERAIIEEINEGRQTITQMELLDKTYPTLSAVIREKLTCPECNSWNSTYHKEYDTIRCNECFTKW